MQWKFLSAELGVQKMNRREYLSFDHISSLGRQARTEEAVPKHGNPIGVKDTQRGGTVFERKKIRQGPDVVLGQNDGKQSSGHFGLKGKEIGDCQ